MTHDRLWIGIAAHGAGWRATVSQGRQRPLIQKHFPKDTDPREMQTWRDDTKAELRVTRKQRATRGTFEADAKRYLAAVTALPTYAERQREIGLWTEVFGTQQRDTITPGQIRAVRDRWLTTRRGKKPPLAPGTVNKRLRALSNLYRVLDGPHVPNPVSGVPEAKEPDPEPKALDYVTIEAILNALPDAGRAKRKHKRPDVSYTKIRLRCLAYCPITPKQLAQLTPADLDLAGSRLRLPARSKGRGSRAIWTPLLAEAVAAFTVFHEEHAYGTFSQSALRKSFISAAKRAGVTAKVYPYMLRHSFGTLAYQATGSLEAVGKLLQHRHAKTTHRYALGADQAVLSATVDRVAQQFGITDRGNLKNDAQSRGVFGAEKTPLPTHSKGGKRRKTA